MSTNFSGAAAIWIAAEKAKTTDQSKSEIDASSATRLRAALTTLTWSGRSLARLIGENERKVRRWASGDYEPPDQLLVWLEILAAFHDKNPPPARA